MPATLAQDRRLDLARPDLAAADLEGIATAGRYVNPERLVCTRPSAPIRNHPDASAEQMDELLFGEIFSVIEEADGWAFGQASRDRYVGYVEAHALGAPTSAPTHWVKALRTYAFVEADLKTPRAALLSMNCLVAVEELNGRYARIAGAGWVNFGHLAPIGEVRGDPAAVALEFLGAPYHWGGRESLGLDCSGLVQNALYACGLSCPRDSDLQEAELGEAVAAEALQRGDLVFWKGHVGMMLDGQELVHANGHAMAVTREPLARVRERIARSGSGPASAYRRLRIQPGIQTAS
jgi:hypothetical protein